MRVFIAALNHETNSFSPIPASLASFEARGLYRPSQLAPEARAAALAPLRPAGGFGDFIACAEARGDDYVVGLAGHAEPSGPLGQADYETLRDEMLADLAAAMPVDAVLLFLHGAQIAHGYDDCEGDILARMRTMLGPDIPIGAELDLHATITDTMVENATALVACKEYPHTDFPERGRELYAIIADAAAGKTKPVTQRRRVPMMAGLHTPSEPARSFIDGAIALEGKDGILSVSIVHGFGLSDLPDTSGNILVVSDGRSEAAERTLTSLARGFFELRLTGEAAAASIEDTLDAAAAVTDGLVVIAEPSDNPGGGWAGDGTWLLREMLKRGVTNAATAILWDPVAVQLASDAGVGAVLPLRIGGKIGPRSGEPLDVTVEVIALNPTARQRSFFSPAGRSFGPAAAVRVEGVTIILGTQRTQALSLDAFTELGLDPASFALIALKSSQHFYAQFGPIAKKVLYCSGMQRGANRRPGSRPHQRLRRPLWPLDEIDFDGTRILEAT
jgi:microcystin degradation protein MlrC